MAHAKRESRYLISRSGPGKKRNAENQKLNKFAGYFLSSHVILVRCYRPDSGVDLYLRLFPVLVILFYFIFNCILKSTHGKTSKIQHRFSIFCIHGICPMKVRQFSIKSLSKIFQFSIIVNTKYRKCMCIIIWLFAFRLNLESTPCLCVYLVS